MRIAVVSIVVLDVSAARERDDGSKRQKFDKESLKGRCHVHISA